MKEQKRFSISGSNTSYERESVHKKKAAHEGIPVMGKRFWLLLLCGMIFCGSVTGCGVARGKTSHAEETPNETEKEESQDMENAKSGISGSIVVSSREEQEAADKTVHKLFDALEAGDEAAIRNLFSPYALENADDLEGKIQELIAYYPGADGGYTGASITTEDNDYGKKQHVLDIILTVTNKGQEYQIDICLQMRNDFEPSMEGVHLIEIIREEEKGADFIWKEKEDAPGVYVGE